MDGRIATKVSARRLSSMGDSEPCHNHNRKRQPTQGGNWRPKLALAGELSAGAVQCGSHRL